MTAQAATRTPIPVHKQIADTFRASHGDMVDWAIKQGDIVVIDEQQSSGQTHEYNSNKN